MNATVLAVDDEPDITMAVRMLLEKRLGVRVIESNLPLDALALLQTEKIDLIVSDYNMPQMDGLAFLEKAALALPDVPRALLTSARDFDMAVRAVTDNKIGAFFTKPLDSKKFVQSVGDILEARERAKLEKEGFKQAANTFRRESALTGNKDRATPFVGSLLPSDEERRRSGP